MKHLSIRYTIKPGREHPVQLLHSSDDELGRTVRSPRVTVERDGERVLPA
jgi:hypothetical protein